MTQFAATAPVSGGERSSPIPQEGKPHRIVIVGGGAAGLELATRLGDTLGKRARAVVTLVERTGTHLWKPLLHEVAAGAVKPSEHEVEHVAHARRHGYQYRQRAMVGLDRARRLVKLYSGPSQTGHGGTPGDEVAYDTLVIAIGSVSNDFGTPGAAANAVALDTPAHALGFYNRLVNACTRAASKDNRFKPARLNIAIIGAGATGTELAAGLQRTARALIGTGSHRLETERGFRIVLIEAAPRILPLFPVRTARVARSMLEKKGIEVYTDQRVAEVRADGVGLADGTFIAADLMVWAAGVKGPAVLSDLDGLEATPRNQLVVSADLSTSRDPNIFAIGDCAAAPRVDFGGLVPPRAQAAHQMASHLAKQMERRLDKRPLKPFLYRDYGALVSLGRHTTVGDLKGPRSERGMFIKGLGAHLMYLSLYKMYETSLHGASAAAFKTLARSL